MSSKYTPFNKSSATLSIFLGISGSLGIVGCFQAEHAPQIEEIECQTEESNNNGILEAGELTTPKPNIYVKGNCLQDVIVSWSSCLYEDDGEGPILSADIHGTRVGRCRILVSAMGQAKIEILFVGVNPENTERLALTTELQQIDDELGKSRLRERCPSTSPPTRRPRGRPTCQSSAEGSSLACDWTTPRMKTWWVSPLST